MAVADPAAAADDELGDGGAAAPPVWACPVLDDDDASSPLVASDSSRALDDPFPFPLPPPANAIKMPATVDSDLLLCNRFFCKSRWQKWSVEGKRERNKHIIP